MILIYYDAMQSRHSTRKWSSTKPTKTTKLTNYSVFDISIRFCMKKRFSATTATITAYRFFFMSLSDDEHPSQPSEFLFMISYPLLRFSVVVWFCYGHLYWKIERKSMSIWTEQLNFCHFFFNARFAMRLYIRRFVMHINNIVSHAASSVSVFRDIFYRSCV